MTLAYPSRRKNKQALPTGEVIYSSSHYYWHSPIQNKPESWKQLKWLAISKFINQNTDLVFKHIKQQTPKVRSWHLCSWSLPLHVSSGPLRAVCSYYTEAIFGFYHSSLKGVSLLLFSFYLTGQVLPEKAILVPPATISL